MTIRRPSCFSLLLFLLLTVAAAAAQTLRGPRGADLWALLQLRRSVSADPGGALLRWTLGGSDHCSWSGVACDPVELRVVAVRVPGAGLRGELSSAISRLDRLQVLDLSGNAFRGSIPAELPRGLRELNLSSNRIAGAIPPSVSACLPLETLDLSGNLLAGPIPASIGRLAHLRHLRLSCNRIGGTLPAELGRLGQLRVLDVSRNRLRGAIPLEIGGCLNLSVIVLSSLVGDGEHNRFEGGFPGSIAILPELRVLWAPRVGIEGALPSNWGECKSLEMVNLAENLLIGEVPKGFGKCDNLRLLNMSLNRLSGSLDANLPLHCTTVFDVSGNQLSGSIPTVTAASCKPHTLSDDLLPIYPLGLSYRALNGAEVPLVDLARYDVVYHNFGRNNFTGPLATLPVHVSALGNGTVYAFIANGNRIPGSLDQILMEKCGDLKGLIVVLSDNEISGQLAEDICEKCRSLVILDVAGNLISGELPSNIGLLENLVALDVSRNRLDGQIPASLDGLKKLNFLSFADNNLTGFIPTGLGQLKTLQSLELPFNSFINNNKISITIMSQPFSRSTILQKAVAHSAASYLKRRSLDSNSQPQPPPAESNNATGLSTIEIASITSASAIVAVLLALVILYFYTKKCKSRRPSRRSPKVKEVVQFVDLEVPLTYEIVVRATGNFNASNCIGSGGFGATYKAEIAPGVLVAIKRLAVGRFQGVQQFQAEVKTLGRYRHANLVTLIGYHLSESEMFLIYNYLPGGNLERFIQERTKRPLSWRTLHKIALDVARALAYLHDSCVPRVLHRDVKPSNILLDNELNAYLSDFGLARLLGNSETHATTGVAGTFGYVAPEYAMTCRVSDKADVYSYGVVLLELLSDKKALDPSFSPYGNGFNIVTWAVTLLKRGRSREFFVEGLWDVAPHDDLVEFLHLGIKCTVDVVSSRPSMKEVVQRLKELRPPTYQS